MICLYLPFKTRHIPMEQVLGIINIYERIDMGSRNYSIDGAYITIADLKPGSEWVIAQCDGQVNPNDPDDTVHLELYMTVDRLTKEALEFTINGTHYTLNRQWQVFGTGSFGIPNPYISESVRNILFFSTNEGDKNDYDRLWELGGQMSENADQGDIWKNIPLAREAMHIMKDKRRCCTEDQAKEFCKMALENYWIDDKETPRLYLSYLDFYHWLWKSTYYEKDRTYHLVNAIDPDISDEEFLDAEKGYRSLLFDPIQRTQEWEDIIYDVEIECDELLKNEPRHMGFCHHYWSTKRAVLAKRGIQWKSPAIMNPHTHFD